MRSRVVVVARFNDFRHRAPAGRRARRRCARRAWRDADVEVYHVPGAFEIPLAAQSRRPTGRVRAVCLPRLPHQGRDAALRVHLVGVRPRDHGGAVEDRCADGVWRPDDELGRGGARARRGRARATRAGRRPRPPSRWWVCSRRCERGAVSDGVARSEARWKGRRQARGAALQALYECEIGGLTVRQALGVLDRVGEPEAAGARRAIGVSRRPWPRGPGARAGPRRADCATRAELAGRADGHASTGRAADGRSRVAGVPETPPRVVINEAIELARAFSGEDAARFVNGVLDGVFKSLKEEGKVVE